MNGIKHSDQVAMIVAMDEARGIGLNGKIPWHLPADLAHFKALTMGGVVVMGRKTWESLPVRFRPLPNRINVVVTRTPEILEVPEGVLKASSPAAAVKAGLEILPEGKKVWIIGGAEIYQQTLDLCGELHLTEVTGVFDADARFPVLDKNFFEISREPSDGCVFARFRAR